MDQQQTEKPESWKQSGLVWLWLSVLALGLDQATKMVVVSFMKLHESIHILPVFNLTYVRNYGAAFSFLSDAGGWQRWFFTIIAIGVSTAIIYWLRQTPRQFTIVNSALALILGGAIGNVIDRTAYGYVIDFLHLYYEQWHYPAFNIADSAICIGAALMIYDSFRTSKQEKSEEKKS
ncbi:signal peptidase II [Algicola sagamiensis]|uniref:signal peptidase II n=1 Tax=Algicola sagamiensis TaxID=163869 RepID=UPI0003711A11|nr:signal peptidase II [Algicola sagamiensis]